MDFRQWEMMSPAALWSRMSAHYRASRLVMDLAVLACIAWALSYVGMNELGRFWESTVREAPVAVDAAGSSSSDKALEKHGLERYLPIVQANVFGTVQQAEKEPGEPEVALENMPPAADNLELLGTVVGTDPSLNTAVILDKTTRIQDLYRVGESVRDSKIRRILRAHVILRTQDRDEVLSMDQDKTASGREREATARESSGPVMRIDRARVEQSLNNLPALMRDARIVPYMEAGRLAGYRLSNIKPGSVYQQLGLRNNDVVLSVNGDTLTGPDQLVSLYEDLSGRGGGSVDLRVRRGSGFETLRYELQ